MSVLRSLLRRSELRYGLVGLVNTLLGLTVILLLKLIGAGDVSANAFGYACGLLLSFTLNSRWTFAYKGKALPALARFVMVISFSYLLNLATVLMCINLLNIDSYAAQAAGVLPFSVASYLGSRWIAFRQTG